MANIKDNPNDTLRFIDKIILGERLRSARQNSNYTADQIAEKIDRTVDYLYQLERGVAFPSLKTLISLSRLYNVSIDYLLQNNSEDPLNKDNFDSERQAFLHRIAKLPTKRYELYKKIADAIDESL